MKVGLVSMCSYFGHNVGNNGNVNLKLKFRYSEMSSYIQLIQMLNNDVGIKVKPAQDKAFALGTWRVKTITVDHDGVGTVTFNSMTDFVETDNLNKLVFLKDEEVKANFEADIDVEDDDEEWD